MDFGYVRLEIHDVLEKDVGVFKVLASNDAGSSSTSGSVKISSYPQNVTSRMPKKKSSRPSQKERNARRSSTTVEGTIRYETTKYWR